VTAADTATLHQLRRFCLALAAGLAVGTAVELLMLEHHEALPQRIPLVLSALALASLAGVAWRPTSRAVRLHRGIMGGLMGGALLGAYEHLEHNAEFAAEIQPNADTSTLVIEAFLGANPLLAPGIYAVIGLLGLAGVWRVRGST